MSKVRHDFDGTSGGRYFFGFGWRMGDLGNLQFLDLMLVKLKDETTKRNYANRSHRFYII